MQAKNIVIAILVLVLIGAVSYLILNSSGDTTVVVEDTSKTETTTEVETPQIVEEVVETPDEVMAEERGDESIIGTSVDGKDIVAYHFGEGKKEILLVAGVHGSYSPNTTALANELISYFKKTDDAVPSGLMVTIIPELNPDGIEIGGTTGRFNANKVDLNRNFDCEWSATAVWKNQEVSGGSEAFSEPEAAALRDYVETYDPSAAIVWFSAEGKVYPSACDTTPSDASVKLAATFATAAGYPAAAEFDAYAITGDMVNWMAKQDISAISVLLSDHQNSEQSKNLAGVKAVLNMYAE